MEERQQLKSFTAFTFLKCYSVVSKKRYWANSFCKYFI
nr:MAG TPA: hypothetical protein [Caudoviricetes sp.]